MVWGLTIYVFYIGDEIVFVGDREILMSFHDSFLSVVLIQLLIWSLSGVQGITLMSQALSFRGEKVGLCLHCWMTPTAAEGEQKFLNCVLQDERWGIRLTSKKYMNSPTKYFTSVSSNDITTCLVFCTCIQSFFFFFLFFSLLLRQKEAISFLVLLLLFKIQ